MLKGNDHSLIHAAKVCLFAALLGKKLDIPEDQLLHILAASVFHDTGRTNNGNDPKHGFMAVKKLIYSSIQLSKETIEIIGCHCLSDRTYKESSIEKLISVFKDADALDRTRTGDLDEKYLRFEESKELIQFAKEVNECLSKMNV
jgi:HD superfamily phosphodiesterase